MSPCGLDLQALPGLARPTPTQRPTSGNGVQVLSQHGNRPIDVLKKSVHYFRRLFRSSFYLCPFLGAEHPVGGLGHPARWPRADHLVLVWRGNLWVP